MDLVEATRLRYRPERITTLFIGESAPHSGKFFYFGNTNMTRFMKQVIAPETANELEFLEHFKARGWYLDDLVLIPINKMKGKERRSHWRQSQPSLQARIEEYQPRAIVTLLVSMHKIVERAAQAAGFAGNIHSVPFPGMSHQNRFREEMSKLLPLLP